MIDNTMKRKHNHNNEYEESFLITHFVHTIMKSVKRLLCTQNVSRKVVRNLLARLTTELWYHDENKVQEKTNYQERGINAWSIMVDKTITTITYIANVLIISRCRKLRNLHERSSTAMSIWTACQRLKICSNIS